MKIIVDYPPNFKAIEKKFGPLSESVVFTYGDTIYSPQQETLSDHLIVHERIHMGQQEGDPESWWKKYLEDPFFRLGQEIEAYHAQYRYYARVQKDRNKRFRFLHQISIDLSSKMYGSLVSYKNAMEMIKRGRRG